jgi:hypothetical protein
MKILLSYGAHAKPFVPELEKLASHFDKGEPNFPKRLSVEKAAMVRKTIRAIEASDEKPELRQLKRD